MLDTNPTVRAATQTVLTALRRFEQKTQAPMSASNRRKLLAASAFCDSQNVGLDCGEAYNQELCSAKSACEWKTTIDTTCTGGAKFTTLSVGCTPSNATQNAYSDSVNAQLEGLLAPLLLCGFSDASACTGENAAMCTSHYEGGCSVRDSVIDSVTSDPTFAGILKAQNRCGMTSQASCEAVSDCEWSEQYDEDFDSCSWGCGPTGVKMTEIINGVCPYDENTKRFQVSGSCRPSHPSVILAAIFALFALVIQMR